MYNVVMTGIQNSFPGYGELQQLERMAESGMTPQQVLVAATPDRQQVDKALQPAQPSGAAADMREALLLARSLGGDPVSRRIYLFTRDHPAFQ